MPTLYRKGKKIHRNDMCHCGSSKKYKKCCLPKEQKRRTIGNLLNDFVNPIDERRKNLKENKNKEEINNE